MTDWLDDVNAQADPWLLTAGRADDPKWRDACLGNGYMGQRVDQDGTCDSYRDMSRSFVAGFYGEASENPSRPEGLTELPRWATLAFQPGAFEQGRDLSVRSDYRQQLDLRTGVLETRYVCETRHARYQVERSVYLSRAVPELAVMSIKITRLVSPASHAGGSADESVAGIAGAGDHILIRESLDADPVVGLKDVSLAADADDLTLAMTTTRGRRLAIRSRLVGDTANRSLSTRCTSRAAHRLYHHTLGEGESVEVTKLVAVVTDERAEDPLAQSGRLLDAADDLAAARQANDAAWADLWASRVEVDHPRLQQLINASLFQMYGALRGDVSWSHGPCGLGGNGWDGCVFWDTDTWTLPVYAVLQPALARSCVAYRARTLGGAKANCRPGEAGARWAWMSCSDGKECCSLAVFQEERHIVSCVALAQWVYARCAGDDDWLEREGYEVIVESARYWASRAQPNDDGSWSIRQVCGSDEHAGLVDDNYTTNVGAAWTLRTAAKLMRRKGAAPPIEWREIADGLRLLWNDEHDVPQQMQQWQHGQVIKQADTTLAAHPWNAPLSADQLARTVDYYRAHYPPAAIMMGQAIDGLIDARLGRVDGLDLALRKLMEHYAGPYYIASESPVNERVPFVTGYGGLLQMLIFGALGLKLEDDHISIKPCLPRGVNRMVLHNGHYAGRPFSVIVTRGSVKTTGSGAGHVRERLGA